MRRKLVHDGDGVRDLLFVDMGELRSVSDACKRRQSEGVTGTKDMRHLAEFPAPVVEAYLNQAGITLGEWMNNPIHVRRMLNDPDLSGFRVDARAVGRAVE